MQTCEQCGAQPAHSYQRWQFSAPGLPRAESVTALCVACARAARRVQEPLTPEAAGLTRDELIAKLDAFFAASGVFEICRRCHEQGTGCCPPSCRIIGPQGCASGKTLFCATFLCAALLNAISEADPATGRLLKWFKTEIGVTEWRVFQMFTRVPATDRDPERPLTLPQRYPDPATLDGDRLRPALAALADEVLEIRRRWQRQEVEESLAKS